jgi:hypothetical protein
MTSDAAVAGGTASDRSPAFTDPSGTSNTAAWQSIPHRKVGGISTANVPSAAIFTGSSAIQYLSPEFVRTTGTNERRDIDTVLVIWVVGHADAREGPGLRTFPSKTFLVAEGVFTPTARMSIK